MNIDRLNRWLTLVANFGVLIGIIFLSIETSQNTASLDISAREYRTSNLINNASMIIESEPLTDVLSKIGYRGDYCLVDLEKFTSLSNQEYLLVRHFAFVGYMTASNQIFYMEQGYTENRGALAVLSKLIPWLDALDMPEADGARRLLQRNQGEIITCTP